jgi:hypothetical protein
MYNPRKALGEISKEFVYIAVDGDRLRNLQQSLIPLSESLTGRCGMPIHRRQYGLLIVTAQELLRSFYDRSGFRWMLNLPLLYEVWPTFSPGESTGYVSISSYYQRHLGSGLFTQAGEREDHLPLSGDVTGTLSASPSCDRSNTSNLAGSVTLAFLDTICGFLGSSYQL